MLEITQEAEETLALAREFVTRCDDYLFHTYGHKPKMRLQLEDALEYLRTYGCKVSTQPLDMTGQPDGDPVTQLQIDRVKVQLFKTNAKFGFDLQWSKKVDGAYMSWMNGGLVWHGPLFPSFTLNTSKQEFQEWAATKLTKDMEGRNYWGIHT